MEDNEIDADDPASHESEHSQPANHAERGIKLEVSDSQPKTVSGIVSTSSSEVQGVVARI